MIKYALLCRHDHSFEAWFRDSETFDEQSGSGQVGCPTCGTAEVRKAVMAPAVRRSRGAAPSVRAEAVEATVPAAPLPEAPVQGPPTLIADEAFGTLRAAVREFHLRLKRNAEDVGPTFPEQARRIHEGDAAPRAIYGTATDDELDALVEDGVHVMPIPALPDDRN